MPCIMNCLDEEVKAVCGGNEFTFKPRQIKFMYNPDIARFLSTAKAEQGLVELPDEYQEKEMQNSPEGQAFINERRAHGIDVYCRRLRMQIQNLKISLQRDLDQKGYKMDARLYASEGDVHALEMLAKYQAKGLDVSQERLNKVKELEQALDKSDR